VGNLSKASRIKKDILSIYLRPQLNHSLAKKPIHSIQPSGVNDEKAFPEDAPIKALRGFLFP